MKNTVPTIKELNLSEIKFVAKGNDSPQLNALIRIAKFSKNARELEIARTHLVKVYKSAVEGQAGSYIRRGTAGKGVTISPGSSMMRDASGDIISAAWEGFFRALSLYDVDSGVPFRAYFMMHIQHRCNKEFYTQTNYLSGTDNKLWRGFLGWLGKQKRSRLKNLSWNESLLEASQSLNCRSEHLNEIIRARKRNTAGVTQFSETFEESEFAVPVCSQEKCEAYQWDISTRYRVPGEIDKVEAWSMIEKTFDEFGSRKEVPTRLEVAEAIKQMFGSSVDIEQIMKSQVFVSLFREKVSKGTDASILANRKKQRDLRRKKLRKVGV